MKTKRVKLTLLTCALTLLVAAQARATDLCGTISSTQTITDNSRLTCDVTCTVMGAPCIRLDADSITLNLNGFTMTGRGPLDSCTFVPSEFGIFTTHSFVSIIGPGLVTRFGSTGIGVFGSNDTVKGVAVSLTCADGIHLEPASSNSEVKNNSVSASFGSGSPFIGDIVVEGSGGNVVKNNEVAGASNSNSTTSPCPASGTCGGGVSCTPSTGTCHGGYGILVNSANNSIVENVSSGISLGIYVIEPLCSGGSNAGKSCTSNANCPSGTCVIHSGNTFDGNQALGNRPYGDISDDNPAGSNTYHDNLCQTSFGADKPTCPNLPEDVVGHQNP